jgi:hypothetical protein
MELSEGKGVTSEVGQKQKEQNTLRAIKGVVQRYGPRLGEAYRSASKNSLFLLAKDAGFRPLEVGPNFSYLDPLGRAAKLSPDNSVRIGKGKMLYVGTDSGKVISFKDLAHDVGVCLMQGAVVPKDQTDKIRVTTILEAVNRRRNINYTADQIVEAVGDPEEINGEVILTASLLLDSIVLDKTLPLEATESF